MAKTGRKKPTVKQIGEFTLNIYDKVRQLERIAMGNSQVFLQYLEMTGELDKFNDYLKNKVEGQDGEKRKERKTREKKSTKGSGTPKTSRKPRKKV
jgi:hypothetical protein